MNKDASRSAAMVFNAFCKPSISCYAVECFDAMARGDAVAVMRSCQPARALFDTSNEAIMNFLHEYVSELTHPNLGTKHDT